MKHFAGLKGKPQASTTAHVETLSIEDKLKFAIINGEKSVGEGAHKQSLEICSKMRSRAVLAAGTHQYRSARWNADGGRVVRRAQDAAAVGARFRRRDEAGGRLPRAEDGEEVGVAERARSCSRP